MTIGARLRKLREQHRISQETMGEYCDVTKGMVSQWENDKVIPPIDRMMKLKNKIHFKLDWLYSEDGSYRPDVEALYQIAEKLPAYAVTELTKEGTSYAKLIEAAKTESNNGTK